MQDTLRAAMTVLSFLTFLGIIWWAMSSRRNQDFDEASHLPLNEPDEVRMNTAAGDVHE